MPGTIEECRLAGCDPETWVKKGWLDYLVAAEYNCTWPGLHVEQFSAFCRGRCTLYAQMGDQLGGSWAGKPRITGRGQAVHAAQPESYRGMLLTVEEARAAAYNFYTWGADGISFWNISCTTGTRGPQTGPEHRERMFHWMNEVIDPDRIRNNRKNYHYLPQWKGFSASKGNFAYRQEHYTPMGGFRGQTLEFPRTAINCRQAFKFRMADGRNGEKTNALLRFRMLEYSPRSRFQFDVNGQPIAGNSLSLVADPDNAELSAYWMELNLRDCSCFRGDNELGVTRLDQENTERNPYMEELEVIVG
jgi:hypothetical protein